MVCGECMTLEFALIVASVALMIGLSKGGLGAVIAVMATPLLQLVMPPKNAISLALPLLIIADAFALRAYWRQWDNRYIRLLIPPAVIGIGIGTLLLANLPDDALRRLLGVLTLMFVAYRRFGGMITSKGYHPRDWHGTLIGGVSGLGSAVANVGGPPFTAYMLLQNVPPQVFVGTTTLFFALVNLIKLPPLILAGIFNVNDLIRVLWVLPLLPFGVWLGKLLVKRINQAAFERLMLVVLTITGLYLLFSPPTT